MSTPDGWPAHGDPVVVWHERPPARTPREPHTSMVTHVGQRTFHVDGLDATFNRSTGRSKTQRDGGELSARQYVAVPAGSPRAYEVLAEQAHRTGTDAAMRAVQAWMADRSEAHRAAAVEALQALAPHDSE